MHNHLIYCKSAASEKRAVGRHTEVDASGVPEFLDLDAPDCSPELDSV